MIGSIFVFILVLSILVLVHEFGHYIVAKKSGIWVEEFGFGIPPRIYGKKIGETIWSINLLPFGGFVRLHGENTQDGITDPERAFLNKSKLKRTAVVTAGVVMNFILAIVAFAIVYSFSGIPRDTNRVKILDIADNSPAQESQLKVGDIVDKVDSKPVNSTGEFVDIVDTRKGDKVALTVSREMDGKTTQEIINITPRKDHPKDEGPLGVVISSTEIYYPPIWQRPFLGVYYGFKEAVFWGKTIIVGLGTIFSQAFSGQVPTEVAGPVGIYAITSEAAKVGALSLINFIGILSVNLAILNIVPFPALDGGRLLFVAIEGIFGRRVLPKVEATIHTIGMIILLILLFAITASDIRRLISAGSISKFLDSFVQ